MNIEFKHKLTGESVMRHQRTKHTGADKAALIVSLSVFSLLSEVNHGTGL